MTRGLLIALEGIDGAGKKTLSRYLVSLLRNNHVNTKVFDYPDYESLWGKIIQNFLFDKVNLNNNEQFFTYFTDIYKDQDTVEKLLSEGTFVVVNRYFASTVAFQCAKGFNYNKALSVLEAATIVIPDICFFAKVEPKVAIERCSKRGDLDRHEKDFKLLKDANLFYEKLIQQERLARKWVSINSMKNIDYVYKDMKEQINLIIEKWKIKC